MTAIPGDDSAIAGRLEIPVEATAKGLKAKIKTLVETAAKDVVAKIEVKLVGEKDLKAKLEAAAEAASKDVVAKIKVELDQKGFKDKFDKLVTDAKTKVKVEVVGLTESVEAEKVKAEKAARRSPLRVLVDARDRLMQSVVGSITRAQAVAKARPVVVDVKTRGGGGKGGGGGLDLPDFLKPDAPARFLFRPTLILGMLSLIQPVIAAIGSGLAGLAAMAANAAASLNLLGAAPAVLLGLVGGITAVTIAFRGLAGDIKDVPKYLLPVRKEFEKLKPLWADLQKDVATSFWKKLTKDIEPIGKSILPVMNKGLSGIAEAMGRTARKTGEWMRTPLFRGQMGAVFTSLRDLTNGFGDALVGSLKGILNLSTAAGPVLGKFADVLRDFGRWASGKGDTPLEQERMGAMFEYAWEKAAQLWDMTKNVGAAIRSIFRAGRGTGDSLLQSLQESIQAMRDWADSPKGQVAIRKWFEQMAPIAREVGSLIVDIAKALGRLSVDSHTADLIKMIREDLLDSLEKFLATLGSSLGPAVIEFLSRLLDVFAQLAAAGGPLATMLGAVTTVLAGIAAVFEAHPGLAQNVGALLGALMGFKALTFFTGLIPGLAAFTNFIKGGGKSGWAGAAGGILLLSGALNGLPGALQGAVAGLSTLAVTLPHLRTGADKFKRSGFRDTLRSVGDAFRYASDAGAGFGGKMRVAGDVIGYGAGAAGRGLIGGGKALLGLLGGPWGLAFAGATTAVGMWMDSQAKAKEIADGLTATIDKQTGAFTDASTGSIVDNLMGDLSAEDIRLVESLGFKLEDVALAALGSGDEVRAMREKIFGTSEEMYIANGIFDDGAQALEGLGRSFNRSAEGAERTKVIGDVKARLAGVKDEASGAADGVNEFGEKVRGSVATTQELAEALERITGVQLNGREASRNYGETMSELKEHMKNVKKGTDDSTAAGRANNAMLDRVAKSTLDLAEKNLAAGKGQGEVTKKVQESRAAFVAAARQMGYSEDAANELANELGLTSTQVQILNNKVKNLPASKKITITASVQSALHDIALVKSLRDQLTNKEITFTTYRRTVLMNGGEPMADGGIVQFAEGGIRARLAGLGDRVKSFANGVENHIAQIARPGEWRVWAEPETDGEAYIPFAMSKRPRSLKILEEVARRFGYALDPLGDMALAGGAGRFASSSLLRSSVTDAHAARRGVSGGGDHSRRVVFEKGAIQVYNPAPEPASRSIASSLRDVGAEGLFGGEDY